MRITCATRLFQNGVNEKQTRERTGHRSDSLFRYQKPSEKQVKVVSDAVAPPVDLSFSTSEFKDETYWSSIVDDEISDEVLASLDIPDCTMLFGTLKCSNDR